MAGNQFKRGFDMIFRRNKCTVYVYRDYGTDDQIVTERQALKNSEKNDSSKVMFQFPEQVDVAIGDVIQQKNANDLWEVYETEDTVIGDVLIHFEAKVNKVGAGKPNRYGGNVIIQGANYGAIQSNSPQSTQNAIVGKTSVSAPIAELRNLLRDSGIDDLDREECEAALARIEELAAREPNQKIASKIREKLDVVNGAFAVAKNVSELASPHIGAIVSSLGLD